MRYLPQCPPGQSCGRTECRHHIAKERWCALEVAKLGASSSETVAAVLGMTRQGIEAVEARALAKLRTKRALRVVYDESEAA